MVHKGAHWIFVEWMTINQETFKCIHSRIYFLNVCYEPDICLGTGKATMTTLILATTITVKAITANVYRTFTMYQASGQALVCIHFQHSAPKIPCGRHYYYSHCTNEERCQATPVDLNVKECLTLKSLKAYLHGLGKDYLWIHSWALRIPVPLPGKALVMLHIAWNLF